MPSGTHGPARGASFPLSYDMLKRTAAALLTALLAAPPAWSQTTRVSIAAPVSPAPFAAAAALNVVAFSPALAATLTPALVPALAPAVTPRPAVPAPDAAPATPVQILAQAAKQAAAAPESISRLYDSAPAAPDFAELSPVKVPVAPAPWRPTSPLLKPAAAVVNAWRLARHERRLGFLGPNERVTAEEFGMRDTLTAAHESLSKGRLQDALDDLKLFKGNWVDRWYRANSSYRPYQRQGHAYLRFTERAIKLAYERAHARAQDSALVAEARAAAGAGTLLGRRWRATPIQDRDSAHCVHHAMFNAISASVGFLQPLSVQRFIERAGETLDVDKGMSVGALKRWARLLGLGVAESAPPRDDAGWSALLGRGREVLISLRLFHERFKNSPEEAAVNGHDYTMLDHEVYLLGAFDSPSRGARLYMVQDSGSGATDFYTADELSAVASDLQLLETPAPVLLP